MFRFWAVVVLISFFSLAQAEIIEFELTGLTGNSADSLKADTLVYHGFPAAVNSISFRVTGTVTDLGEICCGGPEYCPGDTYPWFMTWWGSIERFDDPFYGKWVASTPGYLDQVIPFDLTGTAESQNGFPSIADGDIFDVRLYFGQAAWIGECDLIRAPAGTMVTVTIVMDVSYPLKTETTTWGRVKALFD
jgi:hypothetical protein